MANKLTVKKTTVSAKSGKKNKRLYFMAELKEGKWTVSGPKRAQFERYTKEGVSDYIQEKELFPKDPGFLQVVGRLFTPKDGFEVVFE